MLPPRGPRMNVSPNTCPACMGSNTAGMIRLQIGVVVIKTRRMRNELKADSERTSIAVSDDKSSALVKRQAQRSVFY